jgi:hypothetical protein
MIEQSTQGISREGLDAAFEADEARKSELILSAEILREQTPDEAAARFAKAAQIEESLSQRCETLSLIEKALVHRFSAAGCWAQAGNFYQAIAICDGLLARPDLPERLRRHVRDYLRTLRLRRAHWYEELSLEMAGSVG